MKTPPPTREPGSTSPLRLVSALAAMACVVAVVFGSLGSTSDSAAAAPKPPKPPKTTTTTVPPPPSQSGGPCDHDGQSYSHCYVGLSTGSTLSIEGKSAVLIRNVTITAVAGGPCLYLKNIARLDVINVAAVGCDDRYGIELRGVSDGRIANTSVADVAGSCLYLKGVQRVDVVDVDVTGCDQTGIRISNEVDSFDVSIVGGTVVDTGRAADGSNGSCLTAGQTGAVSHPNLLIDGLSVDLCGASGLDHGIYVQAQDFVIRNVVVGRVTGNGISVRSSGLVETSRINGPVGSGKAGIRYFNDHPCGPSDQVVITGNSLKRARYGVSLLWSSNGEANACGSYRITDNGRVDVDTSPEFDAYDVTIG